MPLPTLLPARVAVLGFARSGRALAEALVERGAEVAVADDRPETAFAGIADRGERDDLIAFLMIATKETKSK